MVYLVSIFSFLLPFVSVVPGCDGKPDGSTLYYGYELLDGTTFAGSSQHLTTLLVVPIGTAVLLFARSFLSHAATFALEAFLQSWEAILAAAAAAMIAGVPYWAFFFDTVFPEIGQYVGTASWAFLSLVGLVEALRLLARLRHAPAALGPPSGRQRWREPVTVLPALLAVTGPAAIFLVSVRNPFEQEGIVSSLTAGAAFLAACLATYCFIIGLRARERWTEVWSRFASVAVLLGGVLSGWMLIERFSLTIPGVVVVWLGATLFSGIIAIVVGNLPMREEAGRFARFFGFVRSPYYLVMAIGTLALMLSTRIAQRGVWLGVAIPIYTILLISGAFAFKARQALHAEVGAEEVRFAGSLGILSGVFALAVTLPRVKVGMLAFWANVAASVLQAAVFLPYAYGQGRRGGPVAATHVPLLALILTILLLGGAYGLGQYAEHLVKSMNAVEAIPKLSGRIQTMEQEHAQLIAARAQAKGKEGPEDAAREIQIMGLEEEIVALRLQRDDQESTSRFSEEMSGRFLAVAISLYLPWLAAAALGIYGLRKIR